MAVGKKVEMGRIEQVLVMHEGEVIGSLTTTSIKRRKVRGEISPRLCEGEIRHRPR